MDELGKDLGYTNKMIDITKEAYVVLMLLGVLVFGWAFQHHMKLSKREKGGRGVMGIETTVLGDVYHLLRIVDVLGYDRSLSDGKFTHEY